MKLNHETKGSQSTAPGDKMTTGYEPMRRGRKIVARNLLVGGCVCAVLLNGVPNLWAGKAQVESKAKVDAPLTGVGENLRAKYEDQLKKLQAEIMQSLPRIDEHKKSAFLGAYAAEAKVSVPVGVPKGAKTVKVADRKDSTGSTQEAENTLRAAKSILTDLDAFLGSDRLDAKLMRAAILAQATPRGLAAFAQKGPQQAALVDKLLSDPVLMKQMLEAGGANGGEYGQAMQFYTDMQNASPRAQEGVFQRLALGTSLEQALRIKQENPETAKNAPAFVDPVKRYLLYEKAYRAGELDPAFPHMTTWEYRLITNSDAPDEILNWGRKMAQNYRPDYIFNPNLHWKYIGFVRSEMSYGSQNVNDYPSLDLYQNCLKGGGVCGRRAFFGRFILQSFGVPVWGVTQKGHAAIGRWTPQGWTVTFGAGFVWAWWGDRSGSDFLLETQARRHPMDYLKVLRAQWIGDVLGEHKIESMKEGTGGFWNVLALYQEKVIVATNKTEKVETIGQQLSEAGEKRAEVSWKADVTPADKKISIGHDGVILIPAAACSHPTKSTGKILFLNSYSGGMQLHYSRPGNPETFAYTFQAPRAGKYALTAQVGTVSMDKADTVQVLLLQVNKDAKPTEIALPFTLGMWQPTKPVAVALVNGENTLRFTMKANNFGVSIKQFTLTPVK
jgi:hypothetical protein